MKSILLKIQIDLLFSLVFLSAFMIIMNVGKENGVAYSQVVQATEKQSESTATSHIDEDEKTLEDSSPFELDQLSYGKDELDEEEKELRRLVHDEEYDKAIKELKNKLGNTNYPWLNKQGDSEPYDSKKFRRLVTLLANAYELNNQIRANYNASYYLYETGFWDDEYFWNISRLIYRESPNTSLVGSVVKALSCRSLGYIENGLTNELVVQMRESNSVDWEKIKICRPVRELYRTRYQCARIVEPRLFWLCEDLPDFEAKNKLVKKTYQKFLKIIEEQYDSVVSRKLSVTGEPFNGAPEVSEAGVFKSNDCADAERYEEELWWLKPFLRKLDELP